MDQMMRIKWRHWMPRRRWRVVGVAPKADLVPQRLPRRGIVIVQGSSDPEWLVFRCACGTERVMLNTNATRWPFWRVRSLAPLSIHPSIDAQHAGRRCHFFIRNGRTRWCEGT